MALAPYTAPALPSDSPVVAAWIAAHVAALPKGAKLREVLRGRTPSGAFVRVVAWRAGGQPSLRVDDGSYGGEADFTGDPTPEAVRRVLGKAEPLAAWEDPRVSRGPTAPGVWLHAAGRDAHPIGTPALADVARRGLVLLVRDDGAATSGAPDRSRSDRRTRTLDSCPRAFAALSAPRSEDEAPRRHPLPRHLVARRDADSVTTGRLRGDSPVRVADIRGQRRERLCGLGRQRHPQGSRRARSAGSGAGSAAGLLQPSSSTRTATRSGARRTARRGIGSESTTGSGGARSRAQGRARAP